MAILVGFPGGLVFGSLPASAGGRGLIYDPGGSHMPQDTYAIAHDYWDQVLQLLKLPSSKACALQQEKPLQWEVQCTTSKSSPGLPKLEKALASKEDPAQPKIKINKLILKIVIKKKKHHVVKEIRPPFLGGGPRNDWVKPLPSGWIGTANRITIWFHHLVLQLSSLLHNLHRSTNLIKIRLQSHKLLLQNLTVHTQSTQYSPRFGYSRFLYHCCFFSSVCLPGSFCFSRLSNSALLPLFSVHHFVSFSFYSSSHWLASPCCNTWRSSCTICLMPH